MVCSDDIADAGLMRTDPLRPSVRTGAPPPKGGARGDAPYPLGSPSGGAVERSETERASRKTGGHRGTPLRFIYR